MEQNTDSLIRLECLKLAASLSNNHHNQATEQYILSFAQKMFDFINGSNENSEQSTLKN